MSQSESSQSMPCSYKLIIILIDNNNRAAANHHHVWPIGLFVQPNYRIVKLYDKSNYFKIVFVSILICQLRSYFSNVSKRMNVALLSGKEKRTVSVKRGLGNIFLQWYQPMAVSLKCRFERTKQQSTRWKEKMLAHASTQPPQSNIRTRNPDQWVIKWGSLSSI